MKENVLKKEFKKSDVERMRNLLKGKYGEKTRSSVGFSKKGSVIISPKTWLLEEYLIFL